MQTKSEVVRGLLGPDARDQSLGSLVLCDLPEPFFRRVIEAHNERVSSRLKRIKPGSYPELEAEVKSLLIPTYGEFQEALDGSSWQHQAVPAQLRKKNDFDTYRRWVLQADPIKTHFRDLFCESPFPAFIPERYRRKHCFVVGKSGSGKSETLKLLALTAKRSDEGLPRRDVSLILIDPHGDLAEELVRQEMYSNALTRHYSQELIYLDPTLGASEGSFPTLNPFDLADKELSELQIERTAQQLTRVFQSLVGGEGSLTLNMETLLLPCLTVLLRRPGSTLFDLLRFFVDDSNHDLVRLGLESANEGHRHFFESLFPQKRFVLTKGSIATKVQSLLNTRAFAKFLARPSSTVDLEEALNTGQSIIVNCASGRVGNQVSEAIGRFVVGMVLSVAFNRAEQPKSSRRPIWMIIDEAQNFISEEIKTILAEARKYALHLTLATQVVGQDMSPQLNKIVLGNTDVKMIGHAGADSQAVMTREMGLDAGMLSGLKVGEFVVQCGSQPAVRMRMSAEHVGNRHRVDGEAWRSMQKIMLERYYAADAGSDGAALAAEPTAGKPKFEETNPFEDADG